jgi:hypothetical protein
MTFDPYLIEGKYPDPYSIQRKIQELKKDPSKELEYKETLNQIRESGMNTHPLIEQFFVES